MSKLAVAFALCASTILAEDRLFGSTDGADGQFPSMALIVYGGPEGTGVCSGSLVSEDLVLTAAHCAKGKAPFVAAGRADMRQYLKARMKESFDENVDEDALGVQERRAVEMHVHPYYNGRRSHDIALIRVEKPFVANERVGFAPIANEAFTGSRNCTSVGYGVVGQSDVFSLLQYADKMPARPAWKCLLAFWNDLICLGDTTRGICPGDSGGPLLCGGVVVGVASHVISLDKRCGRAVVAQFYTDVERNLRWINQVRNQTRSR